VSGRPGWKWQRHGYS
jgi:hypothetical protein